MLKIILERGHIEVISFFNNRWEVYAGQSQEEIAQNLKQVLDRQGYSYTVKKLRPQVMYDASREQILVTVNEEFNFLLIHVSADPVSRIFASVFGVLERYCGVTLISAYPYKEYRKDIMGVMRNLSTYFEGEPWDISQNVNFQFAFMLKMINKKKWQKCLTQKGV